MSAGLILPKYPSLLRKKYSFEYKSYILFLIVVKFCSLTQLRFHRFKIFILCIQVLPSCMYVHYVRAVSTKAWLNS